MTLSPVLPVAATVTPTADLQFVYGYDVARNVTVVDLVLTATGNLALVGGSARLAQDVTRWLLTPEGADPTDPTFGNPLFGLIGQPSDADPTTTLTAMIGQAEATFLDQQQAAAALGFLATNQQVDHFTEVAVTQAGTGWRIEFGIVTRAGTQIPLSIPVATGQ